MQRDEMSSFVERCWKPEVMWSSWAGDVHEWVLAAVWFSSSSYSSSLVLQNRGMHVCLCVCVGMCRCSFEIGVVCRSMTQWFCKIAPQVINSAFEGVGTVQMLGCTSSYLPEQNRISLLLSPCTFWDVMTLSAFVSSISCPTRTACQVLDSFYQLAQRERPFLSPGCLLLHSFVCLHPPSPDFEIGGGGLILQLLFGFFFFCWFVQPADFHWFSATSPFPFLSSPFLPLLA